MISVAKYCKVYGHVYPKCYCTQGKKKKKITPRRVKPENWHGGKSTKTLEQGIKTKGKIKLSFVFLTFRFHTTINLIFSLNFQQKLKRSS